MNITCSTVLCDSAAPVEKVVAQTTTRGINANLPNADLVKKTVTLSTRARIRKTVRTPVSVKDTSATLSDLNRGREHPFVTTVE